MMVLILTFVFTVGVIGIVFYKKLHSDAFVRGTMWFSFGVGICVLWMLDVPKREVSTSYHLVPLSINKELIAIDKPTYVLVNDNYTVNVSHNFLSSQLREVSSENTTIYINDTLKPKLVTYVTEAYGPTFYLCWPFFISGSYRHEIMLPDSNILRIGN